jgi:hypothetical protein
MLYPRDLQNTLCHVEPSLPRLSTYPGVPKIIGRVTTTLPESACKRVYKLSSLQPCEEGVCRQASGLTDGMCLVSHENIDGGLRPQA